MHFISFSCLIALTITSSTSLNEYGKNVQPCLAFPDLIGNISSSTTEYDVRCGLFTYGLYYVERISSVPSLVNFFFFKSQKGIKFCQVHYFNQLRWPWDFYISFHWCGVLHWLFFICWSIVASHGKIPTCSVV